MTARRLAELAIDSAKRPAGAQKRDGIPYLIEQKGRKITTPLMPAYEAQILAQSGATDLVDAWQRVQPDADRHEQAPIPADERAGRMPAV